MDAEPACGVVHEEEAERIAVRIDAAEPSYDGADRSSAPDLAAVEVDRGGRRIWPGAERDGPVGKLSELDAAERGNAVAAARIHHEDSAVRLRAEAVAREGAEELCDVRPRAANEHAVEAPATQDIVAAPAVEGVAAAIAPEVVGGIVAGDPIREPAADDILDIAQRRRTPDAGLLPVREC